jgi:hypothetical protein
LYPFIALPIQDISEIIGLEVCNPVQIIFQVEAEQGRNQNPKTDSGLTFFQTAQGFFIHKHSGSKGLEGDPPPLPGYPDPFAKLNKTVCLVRGQGFMGKSIFGHIFTLQKFKEDYMPSLVLCQFNIGEFISKR